MSQKVMRYLGNHPIQVKASPEEKTQSTNLEVNNDKMTQASFNDTFDAMFQDQDDRMDVENENCPLSSTPVSSKKQESRLAKSYTTNKSTSLLGTQERLQLSSWGLPDPVLRQYNRNGIHSMFQWQVDCLSTGNVLDGGNLVYSAPTSAGKTLVAELLMLKRVLECKKKAIMIFPFVSIAREKMHYLKTLLRDAHVRVGGFMGSQYPRGGFKTVDIAICTIEKANSLINRLLEEGSNTLDKLGIVVVDELHMIGDTSRGYLLELLLTKIQYVSLSAKKDQNQVQIIGMSATLPNLDLLAKWLNAELFKTDFRPVPLTEHIKIGEELFKNNFQLARNLNPLVKIPSDCDNVVYLCLETVMNSNSVLIFCPTKNWCEKMADNIAKEFFNLGKPSPMAEKDPNKSNVRMKLQENIKMQPIKEVLEQLKRSPAGLDPSLAKSISFGVSYHHAGLSYDERDIIEGAFKQGTIKVLISTTTLSAGVNLPARRVIIRSPFSYRNQLLDTLIYRQMIGRAGRKGIDTEGESILMCRPSEKQKVQELVNSDLRPVQSCLVQDNAGSGEETLCSSMKRAILEVIVSGVACTPIQVEKYASCTLLSVSMSSNVSDSSQITDSAINSCIKFLEDQEFIRLQHLDSGVRYMATQLGLACLASSLSPDEGLTVFKELQKARQCFVLENELHIIYQVVPIYAGTNINIDWTNYLTLWESLSDDMKRVGQLVGVEERFLVRAMRGTINLQVGSNARNLSIHHRFYVALALNDLVNEVPLSKVAKKYDASKGMLQGLQQTVSSFAGMVAAFCGKLGWHNLELLIAQFQDRLEFGVQRELIDLCRLTCLNGQRARVLFNSGIDSICILANSKIEDIENILQNCAPFESKKLADGETEKDALSRKDLRSFWVTGLKGVTESEAAKLIVEEAREQLQKDLGVLVTSWGNLKPGENNSVLLNSSLRRRSNSISPSTSTAHYSYLNRKNNTGMKSKKTKKPTRKKVVKKTKSKVKTKTTTTSKSTFEIGSKKVNKNSSFDFSSQMEELFEFENDDDAILNNVPPPNDEKTSMENKENEVDNEIFVKPKTPQFKKKRVSWEELFEPKNTETKPEMTEPETEVKLEPNGNDKTEIFVKPKTPRNTKKRVSNEKQCIVKKKCSPAKVPRLDKLEQQVNPAGNETENDVFGDSFIANFTQQMEKGNNHDGSMAGIINQSCPKTPKYLVNSEKLEFMEDSNNCSNTRAVIKEDSTLSDSFLERAMETYMAQPEKEEENMAQPETEEKDIISESLLERAMDTHMTEPEMKPEVISESLLERAMDTHMTEPETKQEIISESLLERVMKSHMTEPETESKENEVDNEIFVKPNGNDKSVWMLPKVAEIDASNTKSPKSQRLKDRKKRNHAENAIPSKFSPGMIVSDSEEETDQNLAKSKENSKNSNDDSDTKRYLNIVDVCTTRELFFTFREDLKEQKSFGICLACTPYNKKNNPSGLGIGQRITRKSSKKLNDIQNEDCTVEKCDCQIVGIVFSFGDFDAYYVSLTDDIKKHSEADDTITPFSQDQSISLDEKIDLLKMVLKNDYNVLATYRQINVFDFKTFCKLLHLGIGISIQQSKYIKFFDPKVAAWMLEPEDKGDGMNLAKMIMKFKPQLVGLLETLGSSNGRSSVAMNPQTSSIKTKSPRSRAIAECVLVNHLAPVLTTKLKDSGLSHSFENIEMPALISLVNMDLNGFGFDPDECDRQRRVVVTHLNDLEDQAYKLAKRTFSLTSPDETCKVLYNELRLPLNGEIDARRKNSKIKPSCKKEVLQKLVNLDDLPKVILEWRKLNRSVTNVISPMSLAAELHKGLKMSRIYPECFTFTATGRVSLKEPNIQNIPKDFEIEATPQLLKKALGANHNKSRRNRSSSLSLAPYASFLVEALPDESCLVSLRKAFVASSSCLLIAADYSQLELRILAHMSQDPKLLKILGPNNPDVFKSIASKWKKKPIDEIETFERQQAKQIAYGILYGVGANTLSQQLGVSEDEALGFISTFMDTYPGVKKFIEQTILDCKKNGFVTTLKGRKRYLPNINAYSKPQMMAAAERQAVNSTVQGSASDLVKKAMVDIDKKLCIMFPKCTIPLRNGSSNQIKKAKVKIEEGAHFILQLHDELYYEVCEKNVMNCAKLIKESMECVFANMDVAFPVQLKIGPSWGDLVEMHL